VNVARRWPLAVFAVLAITVAANFAVLWVASDDDAAAVEPDYYAKALRWDDAQAERRRSDDLGWSAEVTLEDEDAAGPKVLVRLADAAGAPIAGAAVSIEAIHNRLAAHPVRTRLATDPVRPGVYSSRAPLAAAGQWEIRVRAERGADVFEESVRRELAVGPR
jgi:nitrogen fixation protein FixH